MPGGLSPNLAEAVTRLGAWMPFNAVVKILFSLTGARISEAAARREALASGEALVALEAMAVDLLEEEAPISRSNPGWLQMSVDGAMVPLAGGQWAEARTLALAELRCGGGSLEAGRLSYFSRMAEHTTFPACNVRNASSRGGTGGHRSGGERRR